MDADETKLRLRFFAWAARRRAFAAGAGRGPQGGDARRAERGDSRQRRQFLSGGQDSRGGLTWIQETELIKLSGTVCSETEKEEL